MLHNIWHAYNLLNLVLIKSNKPNNSLIFEFLDMLHMVAR